jgi:hypothetical protein
LCRSRRFRLAGTSYRLITRYSCRCETISQATRCASKKITG